MQDTKNSLPVWIILSLSASYFFATSPINPDAMNLVHGLGWIATAGIGIKHLLGK